MSWLEGIGYVLGGSGIVGGIYTLFTMRAKKESLVIENLTKVIDEVRTTHDLYKKETDEKLDKLERKVTRMEMKDQIQMRCINKAFRCNLPQNGAVCPVVTEFESSQDEINNLQKDDV